MATNEDSFRFEWGADFPAALDAVARSLLGRGVGHNFSPAEISAELMQAAEYSERTPRRPGKGKRLEPSKWEGEMETEQRKQAQAACQRVILPKSKEELPDCFLRRLDAHRHATLSIIPPMQSPESNMDFVKRMSANKANDEPNVIILPRGAQEGLIIACPRETDNEFETRLNVAKKCPGMIIPRGKHETSDNFRLRMTQQVKSKQTIMPKAVDESERVFKKRAEIQHVCLFAIHPLDLKRETEEECFNVRLHAHRELAMMPIEPGDADVLKKFTAEVRRSGDDMSAVKARLEEANRQQEEARAKAEEEMERKAAEEQAAREQAKLAKALQDQEAENEKDAMDKKVQDAFRAQKEAAQARAREAEEAANRQKSFGEEEISLSTIGFMPLKKLLMERGVPKEAVFSCANKMALKEVALKHEQCKLNFKD